MALRVSPSIHLSPAAASASTKKSGTGRALLNLRVIHKTSASSRNTSSSSSSSNVKEDHLKKKTMGIRKSPAAPPLSPLRTAEEMASRLGLEMAIAELERLFCEAIRHPPADAGSPGRRVRVAYQGVRGSYCQEAAALAFPSATCEAFPCGQDMEEAFAALEDRSADRAIVPAENSLDGPIDRNLDLLLRHPGARIVGELVLPVRHSLLCLPGATRSGLRRVVSHPQALSHCQVGLETLGLEFEEVPNAADAARVVSENKVADTAVIGSAISAREFGLRVLEPDFQDPGSNFTRFLQLGLGPTHIGGGGARKTTVAFTLEQGVSGLHLALWALEMCGVRVTRLDQRPNRSRPLRLLEGKACMDYVFVLDLEGSESDPRLAAALAHLTEMADFLRVLGSYPCSYGSTQQRGQPTNLVRQQGPQAKTK